MTVQSVHFTLQTRYRFSEPVHAHVFRLRAMPLSGARQTVLGATLSVTPEVPLCYLTEPIFGNRVACGRLDALHNTLGFTLTGEAILTDEAEQTDEPAPWLKHESDLTRAGEKLRAMSLALPPTGSAEDAILASTHAVHEALTYRAGATNTATDAESALASGHGVCQDFAHVMLALLRLRGIPCRYCAGIVAGIGETHAWVEAWCGTHWIGADPTAGSLCGTTYLTLSRGADFRTAAIETGVFAGTASQSIEASASLTPN